MAGPEFTHVLHRMVAYQALSELVAGKRVLEVGCGQGDGLRHLFALGAREVVGVAEDVRPARRRLRGLGRQVTVRAIRPPRLSVVGAPFDCIVVVDAAQMAGWEDWVVGLKELLAPGGALVIRAQSGDHSTAPGPLDYGDLLSLVEDTFQVVRVFGQAPFVGGSVVELGSPEQEDLPLSLDLSLLGGEPEEVSTYLVVCSDGPLHALEDLGLAVVQVPALGDSALERWWDSLGAEQITSAEGEAAEEPAEPVTVDRVATEQHSSAAEPVLAGGSTQRQSKLASLALEAYLDASGGNFLRWTRSRAR